MKKYEKIQKLNQRKLIAKYRKHRGYSYYPVLERILSNLYEFNSLYYKDIKYFNISIDHLKLFIELDMSNLVFGSEEYATLTVDMLFPGQKFKTPTEKIAYTISIFDVLKVNNAEKLWRLYKLWEADRIKEPSWHLKALQKVLSIGLILKPIKLILKGRKQYA